MNNLHNLFFKQPHFFNSSEKIADRYLNDIFFMLEEKGTNYPKSYILQEEDNKLIYKCIAPGIDQNDLEINVDRKSLSIKLSSNTTSNDLFCFPEKTIKFKKEINSVDSYAELDKGVLKITMPLKEEDKMNKVNFI